MAVNAAAIKELRERTGGGFLECKKALDDTQGDVEKAVDLMRKSGQVKAAKKTARIAAEGVIMLALTEDHKMALMLEVNSETDFVAREESFIKFAQTAADAALVGKVSDIEDLLALKVAAQGDKTINTLREELVAKIGENIQLRRIVLLQSQNPIDYYLHGKRIGVLVELSKPNSILGKDLAMHIAASKPQYINANEVPAGEIEREKAIYLEQALKSGKPKEIAEKMIGGRLQKFTAEITLLGQPFVKDPDVSVADLLKKDGAEVLKFVRFEVGEGLEKKSGDFAAEVEAQIASSKK
jgi:elongation factor Ts